MLLPTASDNPDLPVAAGPLILAFSARPDLGAASTTASSGLKDLDAAATTASNNPGLAEVLDSRDLVKVVTPDRSLPLGSLGRWNWELFF